MSSSGSRRKAAVCQDRGAGPDRGARPEWPCSPLPSSHFQTHHPIQAPREHTVVETESARAPAEHLRVFPSPLRTTSEGAL